MEEEDTIIIQVIFKFEDGRLYNFDVDSTTTLYETKKILSNAAHILKNSFTLYHQGLEYSKVYDEQPLLKLFPNLKKIEFIIKLKKVQEELDENEYDQISVKYNIKQPCREHMGKFLVLYCISCKKSICNECFSLSHNNHNVEEKADYLMPANILMERIFSDSFMFKSDSKLSNYMSCVSFRSIIKTEIFDRMRQLINELENKCINCLEFFSFTEDSTEKNNDLNIELLKKYCTASFIKLKNNIDTKDILINDEVFLSLYNKLKAIKDYKISLFTDNLNKFKAINEIFVPFTQEIKNMSIELNNILFRYIKNDIYAKFKEDVSKNFVDVIQKDDVNRFMFENINMPKSGSILNSPEDIVNKNYHTPNYTQRLLPSILLINDAQKNNNTNHKTNIIENNNNNIMSNINNINNRSNIISSSNKTINTSINNANNRTNIIGNTNQNIINTNTKSISNIHTSMNSINNNINSINNSTNFQHVQHNFTISSPINFSHSHTNMNTNNMNIFNKSNINMSTTIGNNINNNISSNNVNGNKKNHFLFGQNLPDYNNDSVINKEKKVRQEKMEIEETPPTQDSPNNINTEMNYYSQTKLEEIRSNFIDKNLYTSPNTQKKLISVHLPPKKKDENLEHKNSMISNSMQQKGFNLQKKSAEKNIIESTNIATSKNSINNVSIFSGKLIDVLNKENKNKENGEILNEKKEKTTKESPNFVSKTVSSSTSIISGYNNTTCEKCISLKKENTKLNMNLKTPIPSSNNNIITFMYPVFKTNLIKAALDKNTVQEIKINFSDFSKEDPIITEFPNGGAYCNYGNCLYFAGGQEYIKEAGKLFLSISNSFPTQNAVKLPLMKRNHWNHSMISNEGKIYVIGGYNSKKCEIYDINNKSWKDMPDLNEKERQRTMLFIENNYLYCFMGLSQTGILDSIERINLEKMDAEWENLIINHSKHLNLKFYGSGIIRMNQSNKIYFIGGKKQKKTKEIVYKRSIYEFCFDDFEMTVSDYKIENDLIFVENKLYNMDENDCGNFINVGNGFLISMPNLIK